MSNDFRLNIHCSTSENIKLSQPQLNLFYLFNVTPATGKLTSINNFDFVTAGLSWDRSENKISVSLRCSPVFFSECDQLPAGTYPVRVSKHSYIYRKCKNIFNTGINNTIDAIRSGYADIYCRHIDDTSSINGLIGQCNFPVLSYILINSMASRYGINIRDTKNIKIKFPTTPYTTPTRHMQLLSAEEFEKRWRIANASI